MKGNMYGIRVGDDFIPCEISCEITITREMISKTGSWSGQYRAFKYGYADWQITLDAHSFLGVVGSSLNSLIDAQLGGVILDVYISARQSNVEEFDIGGSVLIPAMTITFPNTGKSTFNVTFQGTGDLIFNTTT